MLQWISLYLSPLYLHESFPGACIQRCDSWVLMCMHAHMHTRTHTQHACKHVSLILLHTARLPFRMALPVHTATTSNAQDVQEPRSSPCPHPYLCMCSFTLYNYDGHNCLILVCISPSEFLDTVVATTPVQAPIISHHCCHSQSIPGSPGILSTAYCSPRFSQGDLFGMLLCSESLTAFFSFIR